MADQRAVCRDGIESKRETALNDLAACCVRQLMTMGLPEPQAFQARDCVRGFIDNFSQRAMAGEFEGK